MIYLIGGAAALLAIGILVVVHEFGHFLAAKMFNIGVPVFSVGMGPRIGGFSFKGTDYRFSALPIGGYVQLAGADPFGEEDFEGPPTPPENDFMQKPVWQRLIVLLAGPAANIVLPIVIFSVLFLAGFPEYPAQFGMISYDSPAWHAGLRDGDTVTAVDGYAVGSWRELESLLARRAGERVQLTIAREGAEQVVALPAGSFERRAVNRINVESLGADLVRRSSRVGVNDPQSPAAQAGILSFDGIVAVDGRAVEDWHELMGLLEPKTSARLDLVRHDRETDEITELSVSIQRSSWQPLSDDPWSNPWGFAPADVVAGTVYEGKPAAEAGMIEGDRLYAVDGTPVRDFLHLKALIGSSAVDRIDRSAGTREIELTLLRDGELLQRTFRPELIDDSTVDGTRYRPVIGVMLVPDARLVPERVLRRYPPHTALALGVESTWQAVENVFTVLGSILRLRTDPSKAVGGPVAILTITGQSALMGIHFYAGVVASISVSLAIVNLLPVPALDGGQITVFLIEWIRGRPLSAEMRVRIQMFGVFILFALIILVTISDVYKLIFREF
ncbi:MAG: RIP metalloprotease RseP [Deltaproteobacteria bacterium]|nr:MAG: RIP metalloprotease RseP [Deltaproteobacteria bacterium]